MADISLLKYPNKSHRKLILLPKFSFRLAEFFGLMMGDGGINNGWQVTITLNSLKDKEYVNYAVKLIESLFQIKPSVRLRKGKNAAVISSSSTTMVDFLIANGLISGNKLKGGLRIPEWILLKKSYRIACVRGLIDTDGGLFIHEHSVLGKRYRNIGLCFTSYSLELIKQVSKIFEENQITPHVSNKGRCLYLYKAEAVSLYLKIFGTSNERIMTVYNTWRGA